MIEYRPLVQQGSFVIDAFLICGCHLLDLFALNTNSMLVFSNAV